MSAMTTYKATTTAYRPRVTPLTEPNVPARMGRKPRMTTVLWVGIVLVSAMLLLAAVAPFVIPHDVAAISPLDRLQAPSWTHPFGTDAFGRDLFSRVIYGARLSLSVTMSAVAIGAVPGTILGIMGGAERGWLERIMTQVMDAWLALPAILVALVMAAVFGRSLVVLTFAVGLAGIPAYYRIARAETMRISGETYIEAAQSLGATRPHLFALHILPNIAPTVVVMMTLRTGRLLLAVSALSFIGLGAPPPAPEWGALLADGREYMHSAWWLMMFPGLFIAITVYGFNMLGDGLRDWLDPHHI